MKFETPKIDINVFSENVLTSASEIANSQTVEAARTFLSESAPNQVAVNNILTFTFN